MSTGTILSSHPTTTTSSSNYPPVPNALVFNAEAINHTAVRTISRSDQSKALPAWFNIVSVLVAVNEQYGEEKMKELHQSIKKIGLSQALQMHNYQIIYRQAPNLGCT